MKLDPTKLKDWQIAEAAETEMRPIAEVARDLGVADGELIPYGNSYAKIDAHAVFARTTAHHCKQRFEAGGIVCAVGAQPQPQRKGLPRKKPVIRKIPRESEIFPHSLGIHMNVFCFKNAPHKRNKRMLLPAGARIIGLHLLDVLQNLRGNVRGHRPHRNLPP